LRSFHPELACEIVKIRTLAEKFPEKEAVEIGVGIFTRELDEALLRGEVDLAVHSLKDVPSEVSAELLLAAVPERESPFDAFLSSGGFYLDQLPRGARIGTGSPRRKAQLLCRRPDLEIVPLRGNVQTRLRKMKELGLSGTVLAHAGLKRLSQEKEITEVLSVDVLVPAVGQGALGIMTRQDATQVREALQALEHAPTRLCVLAERSFLRSLRGGCLVPAGALAWIGGEQKPTFPSLPSLPGAAVLLRMAGVVAAPDGSASVRREIAGPLEEGEALGRRLAREILEGGGAKILGSLRPL
jgi:hydroxymethylbilane synthase